MKSLNDGVGCNFDDNRDNVRTTIERIVFDDNSDNVRTTIPTTCDRINVPRSLKGIIQTTINDVRRSRSFELCEISNNRSRLCRDKNYIQQLMTIITNND